MRLSEYTDYTLRVLMYCARNPQARVTIGELAAHHALSKNHLMKVVNDLARQVSESNAKYTERSS